MSDKKPKLDLTSNRDWMDDSKGPYVIAGPCSAETEEQVMKTGLALQKISQVRVFRAGIWKPRTRPNSFEGVGVEGLKWLKSVKEETGLATAVEVANEGHVYEALKFGIDVLWIGARTTANPFSVQEIADTLRALSETRAEGTADQILAAALGGQQKYDESIAILEAAVSRSADQVSPMASLVRAYVIAGKADTAEQFLRSVLTSNPD
ncbi:hypothetical protein IH799_10520, partial [candidate division KSB1 bacterium]|nr:hypothetical protein [candidate division KSB1 bacterium]